MRFCEINTTVNDGKTEPMTLFQLQSELTTGMTLRGVNSLLLCAAEYMCVKDKKEFAYTEMDAADWIDEMGGIAGDTFLEMIRVILSSFTDNSTKEEKKIPEKAKS